MMEYCDGGSLEDALGRGAFHRPGGQRGQEPDLAAICATLRDVAAAMEYLHLMRIVLKDLKPKNVLLMSCQVGSLPHVM